MKSQIGFRRNASRALVWISLLKKTGILVCAAMVTSACPGLEPTVLQASDVSARADGAKRLAIALGGSKQNPAWSPRGSRILFTNFKNGYNRGPADLMVFDLPSGTISRLFSDGASNVNLPGSAWSGRTATIVFSSDALDHDEIFEISQSGSENSLRQLTSRDNRMAYEPSYAPNGRQIVFESHRVGESGRGVITIFDKAKPSTYLPIAQQGDDCRQPNWSPSGAHIVYQCKTGRGWKLWLYKVATGRSGLLTDWNGDMADASFSPDGRRIVFSGETSDMAYANLFVVPVAGGAPKRVTFNNGYDGAPSWSSNAKWIAFESSSRPSNSTFLMIIPAP